MYQSESKELQSYAASLNRDTILEEDVFIRIIDTEDPVERQTLLTFLRQRARELKCCRDFEGMLKAHLAATGNLFAGGMQNTVQYENPPLPGLQCGDWTADPNGVRKEFETNNGRQIKIACPHPIEPVEILRNRVTGLEKVKIAFCKYGKWQEITIDRNVIADKNKLVSLAQYGVEVNTETARYLMLFFSDVLSANRERIPVRESTAQCGWLDPERFVPYAENISFDGDMSFQPLFEHLTSHGDFVEWKRYCRGLRKNLYLRLQMAASFAAPLLKKIGALSFVLHLWGGTGSGKTVGLMVAMSIWGDPELGSLVKTMNMTANSMSEVAAFLNHIPFAGDELQIIKNRWNNNYDDLIMYLTEGVNRSRLQQSGRLEQQRSWCTAFLFTGEEPITKSSSGGGAKNRVIEIGLKNGCKVIEDGNATANFVREHYGHAGKIWVEHIAKQDLKEPYQTLFRELLQCSDTTEKQAMAMACMLLADRLASEWFFPGEEPLLVSDVSGFLTDAKEVDAAARAYDRTLDWIASNRSRFLSERDETCYSTPTELWGRIDMKEYRALVNKSVLEKQLRSEGFDCTAILKAWAEQGLLQKNSQGRYAHQTTIRGVSASYVRIRLPLATDGEEHEESSDVWQLSDLQTWENLLTDLT